MFHRLKRGWSKLALSQKAGLDQRTITFIENGVNVPSLVTLFVICRALGINVTTVVGNAAKGKAPAKRPQKEASKKPESLISDAELKMRVPRTSRK